eukprot:2078371-Prymnesium_polylepis.1
MGDKENACVTNVLNGRAATKPTLMPAEPAEQRLRAENKELHQELVLVRQENTELRRKLTLAESETVRKQRENEELRQENEALRAQREQQSARAPVWLIEGHALLGRRVRRFFGGCPPADGT